MAHPKAVFSLLGVSDWERLVYAGLAGGRGDAGHALTFFYADDNISAGVS